MEGKLGRLLERVGLQKPQQRDGEDYFDYLNRRTPSMGDELRESMEQSMKPGIAYKLPGVELVPVQWPGFRPEEVPSLILGPLPQMPDVPQGGMNN